MFFLLFLFFCWLIILTFGSFFIWWSNRKLVERVKELQHQLQQLQQRSQEAQTVLEQESLSFDQKEAKSIETTERMTVEEEREFLPTQAEVQDQSSKEVSVDRVAPKKVADELTVASEPQSNDSIAIGQKVMESLRRWIHRGRTMLDWELLIGGRWLNRIGALAIILGLIFFIKYAFDHQLISHEMKVAMVVIIGFFFLWGGRHFSRKQLPIFAQGLVGAGVATLYLAVYAANNVYHLIEGTLAFGLMTLVTLLAFQQALTYHSLAISLLGWSGGYLTPFFVSVSEANTIGLFSYLAFLSLGMILVALKKTNWSILYHLTLVATYLIFFLYLLTQSEPSEWWLRIGFLFIFWAIFYGYELYYLTRPNQWPIALGIMASFHAFFLYSGWVWLLRPNHSDWISESLMLIAVCYLLPLMGLSWRKQLSRAHPFQVIRHALTFCILFNLAPAYHWDGLELILVWLVQTALLIEIASRKGLKWLTNYTAGLLGVVSLALLFESVKDDHWVPIFNLEFLSYLGLTAVFLFAASKQPTTTILHPIFHVAWSTTFLIGFSVEFATLKDGILRLTGDAFTDEITFLHGLILFTSWILYSLCLARIGMQKQIRSLIGTSWFYLALGTFYLAIVALTGQLEIFPVVFWSRLPIFVIAIIALYLHSRWHRMHHPIVSLVSLYGAIFLGFELLTVQIEDLFLYFESNPTQNLSLEDLSFLRYTKWAVMWIAWMLYSLLLIGYGWRRKITSLIKLSTVFYGLCMFGVFIHALQFEALTRFVPVWNFRTLMILVSALVSYGFYRCTSKQGKPKQIAFIFIMLILLFEGIQVEVNDYFQSQLLQLAEHSPSYQVESINFIRPLTLAALWVVFSLPLMWFGLRHRKKWLLWLAWIVLGIGLLFVLIFGISFAPIVYFTPLFNVRSLFFILSVFVLLVLLAWMGNRPLEQLIGWMMVTIFLFVLITVEINDGFRLLMDKDQQSIHQLLNLKQLSFSFAWIIYAILIVVVGLWRKIPTLRWVAMGLFGVSIFKIFFYDLAFLETLYRIVLFLGLGIVLLLVSYVYQRYKHLFVLTQQHPSSSEQEKDPS